MLDGPTSYHAWSQNMIVFLKGRKLWRYVTGLIPKPVPSPQSSATAAADASTTIVRVDDYEERLEEWESIQSKILSWFINTSIPSIHNLLPRFETATTAWKFLADRYNCTNDSSLEFHIESRVYQMRQKTVKELISEENRRLTHHMSSSDHVLATPSPQPPIAAFTVPPRINSGHLTSQSSKGTRCEFCRAKGYVISVCRKLQKFLQDQNKASFPQAAAVCPSAPSALTGPSLASSLTTADIEAVIQQVLSRTSTALSVTSGSPDGSSAWDRL
ncbi:hypothetical protein ACOSQ4_000338 [Xanthoceras sorbifolium]